MSEQLSFIIADLRRFTAEETLALSLDIQANLQEDTPRDTSWARVNWVMSVGEAAIDPSVSDVTDPTPAQVARAGVRQQKSVGDVSDYSDISMGAIFTTNNVPYIGPLNAGHSPQAAAGFIQRAVADAINYANVRPGSPGGFRASRETANIAAAFPRRR